MSGRHDLWKVHICHLWYFTKSLSKCTDWTRTVGLYVVCVNVSYGTNVAAPKSTLIYVTHAWVVVQAWDLLIYVLFLHVVYVYTYIPKLAHTCDTVTAFKVRRGLHMWVWCDTVLGASHRNLLSSSRPTLDAISSYGHPSVRIMITIVMIINAWRRRFRDQIDNLGDELRVFLDWHLL